MVESCLRWQKRSATIWSRESCLQLARSPARSGKRSLCTKHGHDQKHHDCYILLPSVCRGSCCLCSCPEYVVSLSPPLPCVFVAPKQYAGSRDPDCAGHVATSAYTIVDQLDNNWRGDIGIGMAGGGCADRIQIVKCGTFPPSPSQRAQADSAQAATVHRRHHGDTRP